MYKWQLPSGKLHFQNIAAHHVRARGLHPEWMPDVILQHKLEQAAVHAQRTFHAELPRHLAKSAYTCVYMGWRDENNPISFLANPSDWPSSTERHSHALVTFHWQVAGAHSLEQCMLAYNICARGIRLPRVLEDGSLHDPGSTDYWLQLLQQASHEAAKEWSGKLNEDHGHSCVCTYPEIKRYCK